MSKTPTKALPVAPKNGFLKKPEPQPAKRPLKTHRLLPFTYTEWDAIDDDCLTYVDATFQADFGVFKKGEKVGALTVDTGRGFVGEVDDDGIYIRICGLALEATPYVLPAVRAELDTYLGLDAKKALDAVGIVAGQVDNFGAALEELRVEKMKRKRNLFTELLEGLHELAALDNVETGYLRTTAAPLRATAAPLRTTLPDLPGPHMHDEEDDLPFVARNGVYTKSGGGR